MTILSRFAVCIALTATAASALAGPSNRVDWAGAAKADGYDDALAWKPDFENRKIWAHPGETADVKNRRSKLDSRNLKNWIDAATGKPATSMPDKNTDIYLPPSDTPYKVNWKIRNQEHAAITARHITVGRGAFWASSGLICHGNIWIKQGARMSNHGSLTLAGPAATFFRNDNGDPTRPERTEGSSVSQYITFNKRGGSGEFVGTFSTGDEFRVMAGTLIVGRDSRVQPGRNATPIIKPDGTLALMDGARFGKWVNQLSVIDLIVEGTLQGGLPHRPLTRNAKLGVSYQNTNGVSFYENNLLQKPRNRNLEDRIVPLIFNEGSTLRTYSTDLDKARLVIGWVGLDAADWHTSGHAFRRSPQEAKDYLRQQLGKLPKGVVTALFEKGVTVDGVEFDEFQEGGLLLVDPAARAQWKHVNYGPNNQVSGEKIFAEVESFNARGATYRLASEPADQARSD
jgi:hypothetical protein